MSLLLERLEDRTFFAGYNATSVTDFIADINASNKTAEADTITLMPGKLYTLKAVNNTTHGPTGLPLITGKLTIVGSGGAVIERSSILGTPEFRLLDVAAGASLTLKNLTLRDGMAIGGPISPPKYIGAQGGAARNEGALTLTGVTVQNNTARGVGIIGNAKPSTARFNGFGGGIYSTGTLTVSGSTFRGNSATGVNGNRGDFGRAGGSSGSASGGAIYIAGGTATISSSSITANGTLGGNGGNGGTGGFLGTPGDGANGGNGLGGGIFVLAGTVTISNSSINSNTVRGGKGGDGGGGYLPGRAGTGGSAFGGGIYAGSGVLTLRNVRITSNVATGGTAGSGYPSATRGLGIGGGLYISTTASARLDTFTKTHFTLNSASTSNKDIFGSFTTIA